MSGLRLAGALAALVAVGLGFAALTANPPPRPLKPGAQLALGTDRPLTRIAIGSGADQRRPEPLWDTIAAEHPDLFLFMGDAVHGDDGRDRPSLPDLRAAYHRLNQLWAFRRLRRTTPVLAIWNSHDYGSAEAGAGFPFKAQSKALFMQFWAIPPDASRARHPGLYDSRIIGPPGQRVQVILLDVSWFRTPKKAFEGPEDPALTILGAAQWAWLEGELKKAAELRLIVSPIPVESEARGIERWGNFPRERARLYQLIAQSRTAGIIFLSGDRQAGGVFRLTEGVPYPFFELTSSPLNTPAPVQDQPEPTRLGPLYDRENYGLVSIDWALRTVRLELKNLDGQEVIAASAPLATLAPPAPSANLVREESSP